MTGVTIANKTVARIMASAFGGTARVTNYHDNDERSSIAILSSADRPHDGVTSYGTIGLSDIPIPGNSTTPPLGVEIVGACDSLCTQFGNVIATAAFCVINSRWVCQPGAIFPDVVQAHVPSTTVPHLLFAGSPFLWEELRAQRVEGKTVAWVLAVPISTLERDLASRRGTEELEGLFEQAQIDIYDLDRSSVV
jgi:hypothetical protein